MHLLPKEKYRSWLPHGFNLLNVQATQKRLMLESHVREIFTQAGYKEISLPAFDYAETFQITTRNAKNNPIFQLRARDEEQLAVSSDLTVQVIKAAANGFLESDFKTDSSRFCYIQPVFQDYAWGSGHRREMLQAGIELLNHKKQNRVKEILQIARKCASIGTLQPHILYGDIRVIQQLFQKVPVRIRPELSLAFYNKDTAVIRDICVQARIEKPLTEILSEMPLIFGDKQSIQELKKLCKGYSGLYSLFDEAENLEGVTFDFSLVRELSYYTGPVFEAYIPGKSEKIFTGGVYDELFAKFSDSEDCSACGFALDLSLMVETI